MEWETPIDRMLRERAGKSSEKKVAVLSDEIEELLAARRVIMPNPQR